MVEIIFTSKYSGVFTPDRRYVIDGDTAYVSHDLYQARPETFSVKHVVFCSGAELDERIARLGTANAGALTIIGDSEPHLFR